MLRLREQVLSKVLITSPYDRAADPAVLREAAVRKNEQSIDETIAMSAPRNLLGVMLPIQLLPIFYSTECNLPFDPTRAALVLSRHIAWQNARWRSDRASLPLAFLTNSPARR